MRKGVFIAMIIVAIGIAWLLNTMQVISGVDWIWTAALGATGVAMFALTPLNKVTFIVGVFLIVGSIFSIARQTGLIRVDVEVPLLVICFGLLFLIAQSPIIPYPKAFLDMKEEEARQGKSTH